MNPASEIVAVVDDHNRVIGATTRREMRARRLTHRATYILVFNGSGELFVQKRTMRKDVYPGYFDVAAGGVVLAEETYDQGAARELDEEMGIKNVPLNYLFEFYFADGGMRVWGRAYSCEFDGRVVLQEEEVASGDFFTIREVLKMAARSPFTPDGLYVLRRFLARCASNRS
ncbi:MAG: NUDIX hydrolase YfcD [Desulfobacterales bacterium]|nr:MAG: NUDIX hydrolase YfcD [Desulfobacterales bacterium]